MSTTNDERYFELIARALRVCAKYKPMFGQGIKSGGMGLEQFQKLYGSDPFYSWVGLDSPLMYAAHKAAGGMTSIYRQLGIGCQWVFNTILQDGLGLTAKQAGWSYQVPGPSDAVKPRTLSLDGRIDLTDIHDVKAKARVQSWMEGVEERLLLDAAIRKRIKGVVFEVRQGYKSKDSKRQNGDISNASNAYANLYIPVLVLLSTQIDGDCALRYSQARWLLLKGTTVGTVQDSTYSFCREVVGYDLAGFFERNSPRIKTELELVLKALLQPT